MTRKHFIYIAKIIRNMLESEQNGWECDIVEAFADFCEAENPQFDREKFIKACEPRDIEKIENEWICEQCHHATQWDRYEDGSPICNKCDIDMVKNW